MNYVLKLSKDKHSLQEDITAPIFSPLEQNDNLCDSFVSKC